VKPFDLLVAPGTAAAFDPQTPTIVAVTLHARSVASAAREEFAAGLATLPFDSRLISISTCHRVEVYASPRAGGMPELPPLPPGTGRLVDVDAVRHLMEVACGLDSAVFGEDQVLHQLRTSLAERHRAGRLDPVLDRLFHAALPARGSTGRPDRWQTWPSTGSRERRGNSTAATCWWWGPAAWDDSPCSPPAGGAPGCWS
jgi:hypothetical protein